MRSEYLHGQKKRLNTAKLIIHVANSKKVPSTEDQEIDTVIKKKCCILISTTLFVESINNGKITLTLKHREHNW